MIAGKPGNSPSPIFLLQPEAPFLIGMRVFDAMRDFQMEWWRAWCGLLGQISPAEPIEPASVADAPGQVPAESQPAQSI